MQKKVIKTLFANSKKKKTIQSPSLLRSILINFFVHFFVSYFSSLFKILRFFFTETCPNAWPILSILFHIFGFFFSFEFFWDLPYSLALFSILFHIFWIFCKFFYYTFLGLGQVDTNTWSIFWPTFGSLKRVV